MKKYLITTADIKRIKKCRDVQGSWTAFNALAPIEPLTDEQVHQVLREAGAISVNTLDFRTTRGQQLTQPEKDNLAFDMRICRAIERHIIGDETP